MHIKLKEVAKERYGNETAKEIKERIDDFDFDRFPCFPSFVVVCLSAYPLLVFRVLSLHVFIL